MITAPSPIVPERVAERRKALGLTQAQLGQLIGSSQQAIDMIERGQVRRPKRLHEIATALKSTPEYLVAASDTPDGVQGPIPVSGRLPYAGVVQAGAFLMLDDYFNQDDSDQMVPLGVSPHPEFLKIRQGAWQARGDSMDLAKPPILDGMWIVAGDYPDYVDQVGELGNGAYVVVERVTDGGSKRERTVKEVQFARRGMRLIPHSSNPAHKEFFIPLDQEADSDTEMVHIIAVVLWAGWDMDPRSR